MTQFRIYKHVGRKSRLANVIVSILIWTTASISNGVGHAIYHKSAPLDPAATKSLPGQGRLVTWDTVVAALDVNAQNDLRWFKMVTGAS